MLLKLVFVISMIGGIGYMNFQNMKRYGDIYNKPPFYGIYKTNIFIIGNDTLPPLNTNSKRWKELIIQQNGAKIISMTDSSERYKVDVDTIKNRIIFTSIKQIDVKYNLQYQSNKTTMTLAGNWGKDSLKVILNRIDINKFLLLNRGFHWINDYPFNK